MKKILNVLGIGTALAFSCQSFAIDCRFIATYTEFKTFETDDKAKNNNQAYQCKVGGWCTQGGAFAPGTGWAWEQAWTHLGECDGDSGTPFNVAPRISNLDSFRTTLSNNLVFNADDYAIDSDGYIADYYWTLGDGTTTSATSIQHTYSELGFYPVTLSITDNGGKTAEAETHVSISLEPSDACPAPIFYPDVTFSKGVVVQNAGVDYRCTATYCRESSNFLATFEPGYGTHWQDHWESLGPCSENNDYNQSPSAFISVLSPTVALEAIQFGSERSSDEDGQIIAFDWDFGDGNASALESPVHTYAEAGLYTVTLSVQDNLGADDSTTRQVFVSSPANPNCWAPPFYVGIDANMGDIVQFEGNDYLCLMDGVCSGHFSFALPGLDDSFVWQDLGSCSSEPPVIPDTCASTTPVYNNANSYVTGDIVRNIGKKFECIVGGWCSVGDWAFTPGTGVYWTQAWTELGECL